MKQPDPLHTVRAPAVILDDVLQAFNMQAKKYEELIALTREESARIRRGEIAGIHALITQKQILIDRITEQDSQMRPALEQWDSMQAGITDAERASLQRSISRLTSLLEIIQNLDKQNEEELRQQLGNVGAQLREVSQQKTAFNAYQGISANTGNMISESRFLDRKE